MRRTVGEHQQAVRVLLSPLADRDPLALTGLTQRTLAGRGGAPLVLARAVTSPIDLPPFDNSQMDGYAVRLPDVGIGRSLPVAAPIAAGAGIHILEPGTVAPIMTGAPLPVGAGAVIPIEEATPPIFADPAVRSEVSFARVPEQGAYVRRRGSDIPAGGELLAAGTRLGAAQWGVLAAAGITEVEVLRPLRVLVVSTGDELSEPGTALLPGRIFDANGTSMAIACAEGGAAITAAPTLADDADAARTLLAEHGPGADLVVTTGGVSAGMFEVVREVLEPAGVEFGSVAMQPGGPQGLGMAALADAGGAPFSVPVIAFPGNPVSALVSFEVFLRPVLRELHGLPARRPSSTAPLAAGLDSPEAKHQVRRGRLTEDGQVELVGGPSSHLLHGYASSTHLVHVPVGVSRLDAGDPVEIWRIDD